MLMYVRTVVDSHSFPQFNILDRPGYCSFCLVFESIW